MNSIIKSLIFLITLSGFAQQELSLQECYNLVASNYPMAQQSSLLAKQNAIDIDVIETERLPKIELSAQATYQSDVIEVPIPNSSIIPLNKDQYRATLSVNQLIYGGGLIDASRQAKYTALQASQKQVEVNLYHLKKQVNQLYFSVLLAQENQLLFIERIETLETKLNEVKSGIKYGTLLPTSDKVIEVELLKIGQKKEAVDLSRASLLQTLGSLIGQNISVNTSLKNEAVIISENTQLIRPELELFQFKKDQIEASEVIIAKKNAPKLFGFANGGYGNPGLNMLDNSFQTFYTVGIKVNWNVFDWNASKKERQSLAVNKEIVDTENEIFQLNTNIQLKRQQSEIDKIEIFITSDEQIISLRKQVLNAAESQLKNGVITASAYLTELNDLFEDQNTLTTHKIQLALAKANYKTIQGQ
jgi:outer membrane protein TolC